MTKADDPQCPKVRSLWSKSSLILSGWSKLGCHQLHRQAVGIPAPLAKPRTGSSNLLVRHFPKFGWSWSRWYQPGIEAVREILFHQISRRFPGKPCPIPRHNTWSLTWGPIVKIIREKIKSISKNHTNPLLPSSFDRFFAECTAISATRRTHRLLLKNQAQ